MINQDNGYLYIFTVSVSGMLTLTDVLLKSSLNICSRSGYLFNEDNPKMKLVHFPDADHVVITTETGYLFCFDIIIEENGIFIFNVKK